MNKKEKIRISLVLALTVAIIFGFLSGIVGELWINSFLVPEIQSRDFSDLTKRLDELTTQQQKANKDLLSEQDFSINSVVEKIQPSLVTFYKYKASSANTTSVYLDKEVLGAGFVLTNDGWLLTTKQVITDPKIRYNVEVNNQIYEVQEIVADSITDAVFVKIDAINLAIAQMSTKNTLNYAQSVLIATQNKGVRRTTINDLFYSPKESRESLISSSENYYHHILLDNNFEKNCLGAPVVTLDGVVVGLLTDEQGLVLPIDYIVNIIKSAVQKGEITRNFLGVNYLDLQQSSNFLSDYHAGALLLSDGLRPAVVNNSPASVAGLLANDIIVKVENEQVNQSNSLTQLIQEYQPNSEISITIVRDGQEMTLKLVLDTL